MPAPAASAATARAAWTTRIAARSLLYVGGDLNLGHHIGPLHRLAFLELVDHLHAGHHLADYGVLAVEEGAVGIHDEELRIGRIVAGSTGHADDAALERRLGELRLEIWIFRAAGAVLVLAVAGLGHEAGDHAVER